MPDVHLFIQLGYLPPLDILIFGFAMFLVLKFVLFEPRTSSKRFLSLSLIFLLPITALICLNFAIGFALSIIHAMSNSFPRYLTICSAILLYFGVGMYFKPFKKLNQWFISKLNRFGNQNYFKKHLLSWVLIFWLIVSPILIFVPYRIYSQNRPTMSGGRNIGIWTTAYYYDIDNPDHLPNETLELLANNSIYVVITIKEKDIGSELVERLTRCKDFGIEVHLSMSVMNISYKYVNIWNIETLMPQIDTILSFLNTSNLLGNPVTTVVYDMEYLPEALFLIYTNSTIRNKLPEYYTLQEAFKEFNQHIQDDFNLSIRICTDYAQGFDRKDLDDDLIAMRGLMGDDTATMSYMVYRRDNLGQNHILDHLRFLERGDTIILNAWKFEGYLCWNNLNCAIEDARLVLSYPGKVVHLEIWTLYYFLKSYGLEGFHTFINALTNDWTTWPTISIKNTFPSSTFWDLVLFGISLLDYFGPLFRLFNNAI